MVAQGLTGFEQTPQILAAYPGARAALMSRTGDLVEVSADGGELAGRLP